MTTSQYFNNYTYTPTQNMADDLIVEAIKIHGYDVKYIPRTTVNLDDLYGEDVQSKFTDAIGIEMYIKDFDDYGGQHDIMSKFGLEVRNTLTLVVSRTRFFQETFVNNIPNEGDLIYIPMFRFLFQIDYVEDEKPFYQLGKKMTFEFNCSLFNYSQEQFATGDTSLDGISDLYGNEDSVVNDAYADNVQIDAESDTLLDYNEDNPFGELNT